jgi:hypothetical protein
MKAQLNQADAMLEPELRELCGELTPEQRNKTAKKFARWVDQLLASAALTHPELVATKPPPDVPRGFILVNLAKWQQDDLRELARECGADLRGVLGWAITTVKMELREKIRIAKLLGVDPKACWRLCHGDEKN